MNLFLSDYFYYYPVIALIVCVFFVLRGLRAVAAKMVYRYFIPFLLLCTSITLWPDEYYADLSKILSLAIFFFLVFLALYDLALVARSRFRKFNALRQGSKNQADYIGEIYKALKMVSAMNLGALVVLEKRDRLDPHVSGGIPFDAEVNAEVLSAIFTKDSPVHDGGVVISQGRVSSLKSILPLSANSLLSSKFGTRHRAAVGITEKTDAIVFVVSEERNTLSIAYNGKLVPVSSRTQLEETLKQARRSRPRQGRKAGTSRLSR